MKNTNMKGDCSRGVRKCVQKIRQKQKESDGKERHNIIGRAVG